MRSTTIVPAPIRFPLRRGAIVAASLLLLVQSGKAQAPAGGESTTNSSYDVVRVEEDWELVVGSPAPSSDAPQITCVMSPTPDVTPGYVAFQLNHQGKPTFSPGGMQLQVWMGGEASILGNSNDGIVLSQPGEAVAWTQQMAIDSGAITVTILNGTSQSWGAFSGQPRVGFATPLLNLNGYTSAVSAQYSKIGFGANRVQSLTLKEVRFYAANNKLLSREGPRVIYQGS